MNIPYGIYLFSYANLAKEGTDEAKWTLELMKKYNVKPTLPVYYDLENWEYLDGSQRAPSKPTTYEAIVKNYMNVMQEAGVNAHVYSYQAYLNSALKSNNIWKYVSWVAAYTNTLDFVNTVYPYQTSLYGWQYSSRESIPGVTGDCDVSAFANYKQVVSVPRVYNTSIEVKNAGLQVTWTPVENVKNYALFRSVNGAAYTKIADLKTTTYLDQNVKSGYRYSYYVNADTERVETVEKVVEVEDPETTEETSEEPAEPVTQIVTENVIVKDTVKTVIATKTFLSSPKTKLSKSGKKNIKVKWNKITGASGYVIYRKQGTGSYKKIKTIKKQKTTSYTDKSVKKGKKYTYYVKAYKGSEYSSYRSATRKA